MKIGILTFHFSVNYGAVIQTWALQAYLERMGHEVRIVNYDPHPQRFPWWVHSLKRGFRFWNLERKFRAFRRGYLHETALCRDLASLRRLEMDAYVVGSDQVWNIAFFNFDRRYFLDFVDARARKISYAVSIGEGRWEPHREELYRLLKDFSAVSVRENYAKSVVDAYVEHPSVVVPDPTVLVGREDVMNLIGKLATARHYRIFVYGLNAVDRCNKILAEAMKTHPDAEVRVMQLSRSCRVDWCCPIETIAPTPCEWLREIAVADLVITDSFHGVALSVVLKRNFWTFYKAEEPKTRDRLATLLARVGLLDRVVSVENDRVTLPSSVVDYEAVAGRLEEFRGQGADFLREALS